MVAGEWPSVEVVSSLFSIVVAAVTIESSAMGKGQGREHEEHEHNPDRDGRFH